MEEKTITDADFRRLFKDPECQFPSSFLKKLQETDTRYLWADKDALAEHVLSTMKLIHSPYLQRTTEENLTTWEKGWTENLQLLESCISLAEALKPRYFRPSKFLRFNKDLIAMKNPNLDRK